MQSILTARPAFDGVIVLDSSSSEPYGTESRKDLCSIFGFDPFNFVVQVMDKQPLGALRAKLVELAGIFFPDKPMVEVDDDDMVDPEVVTLMREGFARRPVVVGDFMKVLRDQEGHPLDFRRGSKSLYVKPYYKQGNIGCGIRGFTHKAYDHVGGYNVTLQDHEDYDLMKRFELAGFGFHVIQQSLGFVSYHGNSVRSQSGHRF